MLRALHPGYIVLVATLVLSTSAPARARSSGEITVLSNLMAAKYEACRQEAKRQHLHLVARWKFLRACHKKP